MNSKIHAHTIIAKLLLLQLNCLQLAQIIRLINNKRMDTNRTLAVSVIAAPVAAAACYMKYNNRHNKQHDKTAV